jgi:DNA-binding transcriptional regulator YdaS (Cro superfamily)
MKANEFLTEKWSQKYKKSINCSHPKGFSQKAHCAGKKKHNEDVAMEHVCPDCGMCKTHGNLNEIKKGQKDSNGYTKCWPGKHAEGTKKGKNGGLVRNCVPNESVNEEFDGEYDDEAGMFKNDLQTIQRVSTHLEKAIYDNENLPEWCQAKISQAKGMIVAVMDYMISQHENGIVDTMDEEFDLIESAIETLAERNQVDAEVIWEDLETLTDDELYVFATTTTIMETEAWQKANKKDKTDGMSKKAVKTYRREHPGSKLQTAVTTKPSKLKKGSKASKRRKSYCSRSKGQMNMHNISCAKTPDKAICKARRRWNCE